MQNLEVRLMQILSSVFISWGLFYSAMVRGFWEALPSIVWSFVDQVLLWSYEILPELSDWFERQWFLEAFVWVDRFNYILPIYEGAHVIAAVYSICGTIRLARHIKGTLPGVDG